MFPRYYQQCRFAPAPTNPVTGIPPSHPTRPSSDLQCHKCEKHCSQTLPHSFQQLTHVLPNAICRNSFLLLALRTFGKNRRVVGYSVVPYFLTSWHTRPLFSTTYTLFSIRNSSHLFCFVETAHSLRKTPGGGVSVVFLTSITSLLHHAVTSPLPIALAPRAHGARPGAAP